MATLLSDLKDGKRYSVYDARAKADLFFTVTINGGKTMIVFEDTRIPPGPYDPVLLFDNKEWDSIKDA
ncbi:hypothetical protein [Aeromonas media]|uniref:hypothetical protein n=1 Tax=Aeromonas media TaxID=651 RepID=UPI003D1BE9CD